MSLLWAYLVDQQASDHAEDKEMFVFNPETDKPKQEAKTGARAVAPMQVKEPLAHEDAERKGASESSGKKEATASPAAADDPSQRVEVKKKKVVGPDLSNDRFVMKGMFKSFEEDEDEDEDEEVEMKMMMRRRRRSGDGNRIIFCFSVSSLHFKSAQQQQLRSSSRRRSRCRAVLVLLTQ